MQCKALPSIFFFRQEVPDMGHVWYAQLTIFTIIHDFPVEIVEMLRISWESCSIASHGIPRTHREQFALFILSYEILQHRSVVDKCIQFPAEIRSQSNCILSRIQPGRWPQWPPTQNVRIFHWTAFKTRQYCFKKVTLSAASWPLLHCV